MEMMQLETGVVVFVIGYLVGLGTAFVVFGELFEKNKNKA